MRRAQISLAPSVSRQNESITASPNTELGAFSDKVSFCKRLTGRPPGELDRQFKRRVRSHLWTCVEYVNKDCCERFDDEILRKACVVSR